MSQAGEATDKHSDNFYHRFLLHYHYYLFHFCLYCAIDFANWWGFNHPHKCSLLVLAFNLHVSFLPSDYPGFCHLTLNNSPGLHLYFHLENIYRHIIMSLLIPSSRLFNLAHSFSHLIFIDYIPHTIWLALFMFFFILSVHTKALPK